MDVAISDEIVPLCLPLVNIMVSTQQYRVYRQGFQTRMEWFFGLLEAFISGKSTARWNVHLSAEQGREGTVCAGISRMVVAVPLPSSPSLSHDVFETSNSFKIRDQEISHNIRSSLYL